jgi:hypothetical protein
VGGAGKILLQCHGDLEKKIESMKCLETKDFRVGPQQKAAI